MTEALRYLLRVLAFFAALLTFGCYFPLLIVRDALDDLLDAMDVAGDALERISEGRPWRGDDDDWPDDCRAA